MKTTAFLSAAAALALVATAPVIAQQKAPEKAPAKVEVPTGVFYKDLGPTQYQIKARFIGAPVVDKAGGRLGVVDDVILGTKDDKIDGFIMDAGGKKLGFRITAAKVETKDGKTTVSLPQITAEMVKLLPPFGGKPAGK